MGESPATERVIAPDTYDAKKQDSRTTGRGSSPMVQHYPEVRGGICEFCGVLDGNYPSEFQYKLCPHYRGKQLKCSYCPAAKNADDVINHSVMKVTDHPTNPDMLVVCCGSYECSKKHTERFQVSN